MLGPCCQARWQKINEKQYSESAKEKWGVVPPWGREIRACWGTQNHTLECLEGLPKSFKNSYMFWHRFKRMLLPLGSQHTNQNSSKIYQKSMSISESILNQSCHRIFNEICTKMNTKMNTARERGYRFRSGINTICTNCTCWGSVEKLIQLSSQKTTILPPQNPSKVGTKTRPKGHRNLNEISNNLKTFWGAKLWPCWADVVSQDGIKFI